MYYDLLVKIQNAERAKKERLTVPFSIMDFAVAKVLAEGGYIKAAEKRVADKKNFIDIKLVSGAKSPAVSGFKVLSKPSRRVYADYRSLKPVRQGYGMGVLSTSKGTLSSKTAKKNKIGGEYLFQIW